MQPMRGFRKKRHEVIGQTQQMQNVVTAVGTAGRELVGVKRILRNQQPHPRRKPQLPMCQPDDKFPALDEQQQIIRDFPEGNMPRGKAVPVGDIEPVAATHSERSSSGKSGRRKEDPSPGFSTHFRKYCPSSHLGSIEKYNK